MTLAPVLSCVAEDVAPDVGRGAVANYIPALARIDARQFGMTVQAIDGERAAIGAADTEFSIQSISKVFGLTLALQALGEQVWAHVGREPSGNPFNSLIQPEREQGTPRNPFINAGAVRVADLLCTAYSDPKASLAALGEPLCGQPFRFDPEMAASERASGFRNAALAHFMKSFGKLDNDVDAVLDLYFHQCAIALSCTQLARAFVFLAVVPGRLVACVWSPGLDETGNSIARLSALESFVTRTGLSVF